MTQEGFNCFKSIFCILNEKDFKMKKLFIEKQNQNNYNYVYYSSDNVSDPRTNVIQQQLTP